ncbi:hypothetical protein QQ054_10950 [Oscillatoria amoena NRMC-F 0135]|nr:hypothetical protein [Oscillatoria laete-virens]MDL5046551.1 hypothetical protein [Oscillatoria amoena NRMC-F 0135]MDL5054832.1 hypothetical protein [Oscillatoria laete-virens NRMC-F 0139]
MQILKLSRSDFAQLFTIRARKRDMPFGLRFVEPEYEPEPRNLWACWADNPSQDDDLPRLIVVADDDLNDFLAWAVTFLPNIRPLTAYVRVLPWSVFEMARTRPSELASGNLPILAGATLGEAMMHAVGRGFFEGLPLTAFESTFSATLGRALMRGFSSELVQHAGMNWRFARQLTEQPTRQAVPEALDDVWSIILRVSGKRFFRTDFSPRLEAICAGCDELRHAGALSSFSWHNISQGRMSDSSAADAMSSSKERRVEVFEAAAAELMQNSSDQFSASFLVGYLASLVSGGSLEHAPLVFPLQERLPMVMVWYGICSALLPDTRVLTDFSHLGLRIVRAMGGHEELLALPNCDIALAELEVLLRGDPRARRFRQTNASFLRVEVAPNVTTTIKWPGRPGTSGQMALFAGDENQHDSQTVHIQELVNALRGSLSLAERMLSGQSAQTSQGTPQQKGRKRR